jgi:hypothetical protein
MGQRQSLPRGHDAQLLPVLVDHPYFTGADLFVDASRFGANLYLPSLIDAIDAKIRMTDGTNREGIPHARCKTITDTGLAVKYRMGVI